jgi:OmpR-family two-component system manganese-sensing sensor histidine kinase
LTAASARQLDNLLANAVKYSPDGGEIVVRVEPLEQGVQVSVRDPGVEISTAALD